MKGGSVTDSPSNAGVPRLCVGVPLVVYPVPLLNGGCGMCGVPVFGLGAPLLYCAALLSHRPALLRCPRLLFLSCVLPCVLWVGKCGGVYCVVDCVSLFSPALLSLCLLSRHC